LPRTVNQAQATSHPHNGPSKPQPQFAPSRQFHKNLPGPHKKSTSTVSATSQANPFVIRPPAPFARGARPGSRIEISIDSRDYVESARMSEDAAPKAPVEKTGLIRGLNKGHVGVPLDSRKRSRWCRLVREQRWK